MGVLIAATGGIAAGEVLLAAGGVLLADGEVCLQREGFDLQSERFALQPGSFDTRVATTWCLETRDMDDLFFFFSPGP
jgi:hypothetical protein